MDEYSNIDDVCDQLNRIVDGFGFDLTTEDKDLGRDCVEVFAVGVNDLAAQGIGSEGQWATNSDEPEGHGYASFKERAYGVYDAPNDRTGQMTSIESLSNAEIGHDEVDLEYGIGTAPREGVKGRPVKAADVRITDREKAKYAHEGQGPHGVRRPFYALNTDINSGIKDRCQDRLNSYAEEIWGS